MPPQSAPVPERPASAVVTDFVRLQHQLSDPDFAHHYAQAHLATLSADVRWRVSVGLSAGPLPPSAVRLTHRDIGDATVFRQQLADAEFPRDHAPSAHTAQALGHTLGQLLEDWLTPAHAERLTQCQAWADRLAQCGDVGQFLEALHEDIRYQPDYEAQMGLDPAATLHELKISSPSRVFDHGQPIAPLVPVDPRTTPELFGHWLRAELRPQHALTVPAVQRVMAPLVKAQPHPLLTRGGLLQILSDQLLALPVNVRSAYFTQLRQEPFFTPYEYDQLLHAVMRGAGAVPSVIATAANQQYAPAESFDWHQTTTLTIAGDETPTPTDTDTADTPESPPADTADRTDLTTADTGYDVLHKGGLTPALVAPLASHYRLGEHPLHPQAQHELTTLLAAWGAEAAPDVPLPTLVWRLVGSRSDVRAFRAFVTQQLAALAVTDLKEATFSSPHATPPLHPAALAQQRAIWQRIVEQLDWRERELQDRITGDIEFPQHPLHLLHSLSTVLAPAWGRRLFDHLEDGQPLLADVTELPLSALARPTPWLVAATAHAGRPLSDFETQAITDWWAAHAPSLTDMLLSTALRHTRDLRADIFGQVAHLPAAVSDRWVALLRQQLAADPTWLAGRYVPTASSTIEAYHQALQDLSFVLSLPPDQTIALPEVAESLAEFAV